MGKRVIMKQNMNHIIISILCIGTVIHADYYADINNNLLRIDPTFNTKYSGQYPLSESSSQQAVNAACNRQKNFIITELRKTKGGSQARVQLLQDQSAINTACSVLEDVKSRKAYSQKGAEIEQEQKDARELAEAEKRGPKALEKKQKEIADRKKKEEKAERPQPGDPDYVGGMRGYLDRKFTEHKETGAAKLGDLVGDMLVGIEIPSVSTKLFNMNIGLKDMTFIKAPMGSAITTAIGFTGITQFNNVDVRVITYIIRDSNGKAQFSLGIDLPQYYKISDMFPNFKKLDAFSMPNIKLIASSASYTDPDGYQVEKGFNLVASLSLDGPLRALGELRKNASKYDFIVTDMDAPIYLQGLISSLTSAQFKAIVPLRLGIDFTKVKKIPSGFSSVIKKITTDDFKIGVVLSPTDQTINAQTGIQLVLGTQDTPLRLQALGGVDILSGKINAAAKVPDMLELKFMAIGDSLVELYWDPAVASILALFGAPVSGIAVGGRIDLGKPGDQRVSLSAKGKLSLEVKKVADFVLELEGTNLTFTDITSLVFKMAAKAGIKSAQLPPGKIPTLSVSRAYGKLAPWDTIIAGESISAGIQLALDMELFKKKFGFDITIKHKDLLFSGSGYMPPVIFKTNKGLIFKLAGTAVSGGPTVSCTINGMNPLESSFGISTILEVPPIALKSSIELQASGKSFMANFETDYLGFTTVFGVNIPAQDEPDEQAIAERKKEAIERAQEVVKQKEELLRIARDSKMSDEAIKAAQRDLAQAGEQLTNTKTRKEKQPSRWEEMYIKFGFKGDFQKFLSRQAVPVIQQLQKKASAKLAQVDKKIGQLAGELDKLRKQQEQAKSSAGSATQNEITKTQATIKRIKAKIAALDKECKKAPIDKKIIVCPRTTVEIAAQGTALVAQETYLKGLLKPGKQIITTSLDLLNVINQGMQSASKALAEARLFERSAKTIFGGLAKAVDLIGKGASIFKVTEAVGEMNAIELSEGKMPKLVSFQAEINIPELDKVVISLYNLQFDFKNPKESAQDIALQLIKGVKIGDIDLGETVDIMM